MNTRRRGAALWMALGLLLVVAAAGAVIHARTVESANAALRGRSDLDAFWAAEAGIARARAALAADPAWAGGPLALGSSTVTIAVEADGEERRVRSEAHFEPSGGGPAGSPTAARALVVAHLRLAQEGALPAVVSWSRRD